MKDAELIAEAEMSPCMGVCVQDQDSGWCFGCGRTGAEIENWQSYDAGQRESLESSLPDRVKLLIARRKAERGSKRPTRRVQA